MRTPHADGSPSRIPMYILACISLFMAAYLVNALMITVFYHRGLWLLAYVAHLAIALVIALPAGKWALAAIPVPAVLTPRDSSA